MLGVYKYTSKTSPDVGIRPQNETKMESWQWGQSSCVQMKLLLQHSASFPYHQLSFSLVSFPDHQLSFSLVSFPDQRSGYTLCPGIRSYEEEFAETIRFQSKNLRIWCHPAVRHDSNQCLLWHKPNKFQLVNFPHWSHSQTINWAFQAFPLSTVCKIYHVLYVDSRGREGHFHRFVS